MSLSPEERRRIYEEEKARVEAEQSQQKEQSSSQGGTEEQTLTTLRRNTAAVLCYLGGWVTGIIFLVLEQKNYFIRFHAAQSIIVFGFLSLVGSMVSQTPFVGWFFSTIIGILAFILWIVLMVKAGQGELFMIPAAGELAERILGSTRRSSAAPPPPAPETRATVATRVKNNSPRVARADLGRGGRITASALAIAWSIALIVFLNFFHEYVAYYHLENGVWIRETFLTSSFSSWLPVINTVLAFSIAGHAMLLAVDKYVVRETTLLVLDLFGIWAVATLLQIFPFNFSVFGSGLADPLDLSARAILAILIFVIGIGVIVRIVKILVNVLRGTATY